MNLKNKYLIVAIAVIVILAILCIVIGSNGESATKNYINVSDDGAIMFDATGFEVNEVDYLEEIYTGQFDNRTFYSLKDNIGREFEITIHHCSDANLTCDELDYLNSTYDWDRPLWVGTHDGIYYSVLVSRSNADNYPDAGFVEERIVIG